MVENVDSAYLQEAHFQDQNIGHLVFCGNLWHSGVSTCVRGIMVAIF